MNIDKIRPVELYDKVLLVREKSGVEFFLNMHDKFVHIYCPSCDGAGTLKFYKYGYSHIECPNCRTLYVSPRPTQEMLFQYYNNYDAPRVWNDILVATNTERKYLQHATRVEKVVSIIVDSKNARSTFVDIGAGNGNFARAILDRNIFKLVIASDVSDACIESCEKQGLFTKKGTIDSFEDGSIDFISCNDLVEHLFSPFDFLRTCNKKLSSNGYIMLSTPNGEGFDFKVLGASAENIVPPEHIQFFNPASMRLLLEKTGFEIVDISTPGILDVEIIKRHIKNKKFDLESNNSFLSFLYSLENIELEEKFQKFLQDSMLSSHMLVFAKKNI